MSTTIDRINITQTPHDVNRRPAGDPRSLPRQVIPHNVTPGRPRIVMSRNMSMSRYHYGVSPSNRGLSPGLLYKRYDRVRECLGDQLGLTRAQREVVLRLLRLWCYYGKVYPKSDQIADRPGCSRATFFRTIRALESRDLVRVVNRYLVRERAQISSLYLLHNLVVVIARYLAEHGAAIAASWIRRYLILPGGVFWGLLAQGELGVFVDNSPG